MIDHEPPIQIPTELSQEGIQIQAGQAVEVFDPKTGSIDLANAPDELNFNVAQFNKKVINGNFDRVICEFLTTQIDPNLPEKTLIFCVRDEHADRIVDCLKLALAQQYGEIDNDIVAKITGSIDDPLGMIRHFKNEQNPKIVVTVDLLTTGIDVPKICNLVFLRQVNSRILYEQMIGRATRLCDEINKEVFKIYDAVNLYENLKDFTTMKPVVVNPNISFGQLFGELETVNDPAAVETIVDQLFAKLQRKRRHLSPDQTAQIEQLTGFKIGEIVPHLSSQSTPEKVQWLQDKKAIADLLDRRDGGSNPILISNDPDRLREPSQGYGVNRQRPGDYLEGFSQFLQTNLNQIPALLVVTQRPKDLTRQQLKEIKVALDQAGYSEASLRTAWKASKNEDIAASIIGFIRQAALGDALIPYGDRLDRAMKTILASQPWTTPQRKWLERIGKQLQKEYILDRESLDNNPAFKKEGGFARIDKVFDGQLEEILTKLKDNIWQDIS